MARYIRKKDNLYSARLVAGQRVPCAFCLREVDDEITYGKLYAIGDIQCHYFCCLLSCCLIQKGHDDEGLFGFMYTDIVAEVERCKKHKCSYCGRIGANLGCSVSACRKQFHVPCGRERNAVSIYYGSYKSFCQHHAPKQKIPEHIMVKAQLRKVDKTKGKYTTAVGTKQDSESAEEMVCVICYEPVDGFPTVNTFWPPCCGKDAWFHRSCLQRMALSAGMHYFKCPLCNDKERFCNAVVDQGYYVPDRDAAWELEQNAFAEIYERPATCSSEPCLCPLGRSHDAENGEWDIKLCLLCGSSGAHAHCITQSLSSKQATLTLRQSEMPDSLSLDQSGRITEASGLNQLEMKEDKHSLEAGGLRNEVTLASEQPNTSPDKSNTSPDKSNTSPDKSNMSVRFVCRSCLPAAPEDLEALASSIEAIIQREQMQSATEARRPVMRSRMSIRRTKCRPVVDRPSTSRSHNRNVADNRSSESPNVVSSRLELSLKTPRRVLGETTPVTQATDDKLQSPLKVLEQSFREKVEYFLQMYMRPLLKSKEMVCTGVRDAALDAAVATLRSRFRKPGPMCERRRILNDILEGKVDELMDDSKQTEQIKEWRSEKFYCSIEDFKELQYEANDLQKELEECQDKENDSNTFNTPSKGGKNNTVGDGISNVMNIGEKVMIKCAKQCQNDDDNVKNIDNTTINENENIKVIFTNHYDNNEIESNDLKQNEIKLDEALAVNTKETVSFANNFDIQCDTGVEAVHNNESYLDSYKIDEKSNSEAKINNDNYKNWKKSDINIVVTITDSSNESSSKINIDTPKLVYICSGNNDTDIKNFNETEGKTEETINNTKEKSRNLKYSPSESVVIGNGKNNYIKLDDSTANKQDEGEQSNIVSDQDKKNTKNMPIVKRKKVRRRRNSRKGAVKSHKSNHFKDLKKNLSISESSTDNVLKQILIEEDLHSQLLLELTAGKGDDINSLNNSSHSETQKILDDVQNDLNETPKIINNISTSLPEALKTGLVRYLTESAINIDDTLASLIDTPKHKTIDIQQDSSLEISENDQHINIDVIKIKDSPTTGDAYKNLKINIPDHSNTYFKFSPIQETLDKNDIGIDLESFKKEYLNEVDREFKCSFQHKNVEKAIQDRTFGTPIDIALDATFKIDDPNINNKKKRKLSESGYKLVFDNSTVKKRKMSEGDLKLFDYDKNVAETPKNIDETIMENNKGRKDKDKCRERLTREMRKKRKAKKCKRKSSSDKNIEVTIDSSEKRSAKIKKIKKKIKTKFAIKNESIQVKIKWKKKQLSLNIESKKQHKKERKIKNDGSKFKQYILQFPESSAKEVLVRPEKEVSPLKRKYIKNEKNPDKLKQMSIHNFFKCKSEKC